MRRPPGRSCRRLTVRPSPDEKGPPQASSDRADTKTHGQDNTTRQLPLQAARDRDDSRGVILIVNVDGRSLIRWFTARSLVERYLAADRNDDDIIGVSTALFELEESVHDTLADARRAAAAAKEKLVLASAPAGGVA
jgi:hypothetical protein